jgi:hypothetical protein
MSKEIMSSADRLPGSVPSPDDEVMQGARAGGGMEEVRGPDPSSGAAMSMLERITEGEEGKTIDHTEFKGNPENPKVLKPAEFEFEFEDSPGFAQSSPPRPKRNSADDGEFEQAVAASKKTRTEEVLCEQAEKTGLDTAIERSLEDADEEGQEMAEYKQALEESARSKREFEKARMEAAAGIEEVITVEESQESQHSQE